jgi:AraC-like DNA-binding protein
MAARAHERLFLGAKLADCATVWIQSLPDCTLAAEWLPDGSLPHSHHVLQLTIALQDRLHGFAHGQPLTAAHAVLFGPNVPHTVSGAVLHIFVDPLAPLGRRLRGVLAGRPFVVVDPDLTLPIRSGYRLAGADDQLPVATLQCLLDELFQQLERRHASGPVAPADERVLRVIDVLAQNLEERTPLDELADLTLLSPGRLTHLFTREVGLPIKQYMVWLRLVATLRSFASGRQLGYLAHAAGFPDQAAFARTYRKTWGRTPGSFRQSLTHDATGGAARAAARIKLTGLETVTSARDAGVTALTNEVEHGSIPETEGLFGSLYAACRLR